MPDQFLEATGWLFFLPKTLIKTTADPRWAMQYVEDESTKPRSERYAEYMAPVPFFVLGAVVPYALLFQRLFSPKRLAGC